MRRLEDSRVDAILAAVDTARLTADRAYAVAIIRAVRSFIDPLGEKFSCTVGAFLRAGARAARAYGVHASGAVLVSLAHAAERHGILWRDLDD